MSAAKRLWMLSNIWRSWGALGGAFAADQIINETVRALSNREERSWMTRLEI